MLIANPTYDVVFKKLMEDTEIARGVLERILSTRIDQLSFAATESSVQDRERRLTFFRLDFKARIREQTGDWKNVLIELQKAKLATDVERFRWYSSTAPQK